MRRHLVFYVLGALAFAWAGCSADDPMGAGRNNDSSPPGIDAGADTGVDEAVNNDGSDKGEVDAGGESDAGEPEPLPGPFAIPTSGGGEAASSNHRLRLSVGAPEPHGQSASESYRLRLGPLAP